MGLARGQEEPGPPRSSSYHKGDLFVSEGQRTGNNREKCEIEEEGGGEGSKRGKECRPRGELDIGLPLDREETDMAHRQMSVYKGKRGKLHVKMKCLILIGQVKQVSQRGFLVTDPQYFDNRTWQSA